MASSKIRGLTVEIGGDTTKLGKALADVEKQTKGLASELKGVNKLLKLDPNNITLLKQKQDLLTKSIEETREKLKTLKSVQAQVVEQFKNGEIGEEQYRDFQREVEATKIKLQNLKKEMRDFGSVSAQVIADAGEKVKDFGGKVESAGQKLMGVSAAAAAALGGIAKGAIDFETAWTGVTKTVEGTDEELENIKQGILDLAQSTASSATDIAAVAEAAGQLGIKTEDILTFTETMVMMGDTTNLSADEAATALAKFANITQMSAQDYEKLGSAIVDLGNNYATTESDIVAMATRLASTGEITGLTEAQILALATTMSSVGIEAEAGGTAISKLLKKLYSANAGFDNAQKTINATGYSLRELQLMQSNNSKGFKELADSMGLTTTELKGCMTNVAQMNQYASAAGMSVEEFRKAYAEDAVGALSLFVAGLNDTERNGKSAVEILNEMGLTEVRLSNAILAMASSGDLLNNTIQTANTAWGENEALTTEAEKRYATTAAQIQQLKGAVTELCAKLGETLLPIINNLVEGLTKLVNWFTSLPTGVQNTILAVTALVAALAPLLITVGKVVSAVGNIMTYAPQIATVCKGIGTAFSTLASLVTKGIGLLMPLIKGLFALITAHPVIAIITAVIAILVTLWNKCEWFRDGVKKVLSAIGDFLVNLKDGIVNLFGNIGNWFTEKFTAAKNGVQKAWSGVTTWFGNVRKGIDKAFSNFGSWCSTTFKSACQLAQKAWAGAKEYFAGVRKGIDNAFVNIDSWMTEKFGDTWTDIKQTVSGWASYFVDIGGDIVSGLWRGIKSCIGWFTDSLGDFCDTAIDTIKGWFGIKSPSRVMRDQVGKMLGLGMAEGINASVGDVEKAMKGLNDATMGGLGSGGFAIENNLKQRSAQMAMDVTAKSDHVMQTKLDKILSAIEKGQVLMIDGKQFVGGTVNAYDNALGQRRMLAARGAI